MSIKLGQQAQDKITGFAGTVTGIAEYISGCRQALVVAPLAKDGDIKSHWFDEDRLVVLNTETSAQAEGRKGGPQPHPPGKDS